MLRDVYWRQYPVDLLSDDKMACVEAMLPDDQKHIPYMIYIAALKLCDDNGVFDLDDGVVLSRLTRVKDVSIIFKVINLMRQRKVLYRVFDNAMLCGLVDWTYADKKPRTIEERRKLVAERIQKEQSRAGVDKDFSLPGQRTAPEAMQAPAPKAEPRPAPRQEAETEPQPAAFLCPENDKIAENVVNSGMDDKNAKNVVTQQYSTVQDNNTGHTNIQNIHTNTHTQQQVPGFGPVEGPSPEPCQNKNAVGVQNEKINTENANINTSEVASGVDTLSSLKEMTLIDAQDSVENSDTASLVGYLNEFYVKNCYGVYDKSKSAGAINTLARKILELSDDMNPPETIAALLCSEFKKMCDGQRAKYWNRMPLLPANMIKPRAWSELVEYAGRILATNNNSSKFMQAAKKAAAECETEQSLVYDAMRDEFLKYNINPEDPARHQKLLIAKSNEVKPAEAEETDEKQDFDIF